MKMSQDYLFNTKFESAGSTKHTNLWTQRPFYMYSNYLHSMADISTLLKKKNPNMLLNKHNIYFGLSGFTPQQVSDQFTPHPL